MFVCNFKICKSRFKIETIDLDSVRYRGYKRNNTKIKKELHQIKYSATASSIEISKYSRKPDYFVINQRQWYLIFIFVLSTAIT